MVADETSSLFPSGPFSALEPALELPLTLLLCSLSTNHDGRYVRRCISHNQSGKPMTATIVNIYVYGIVHLWSLVMPFTSVLVQSPFLLSLRLGTSQAVP